MKTQMAVLVTALLVPVFAGTAKDIQVGNDNVHESVADGAVVALAFDDPDHPLRDDYGYGDTMKKRENNANDIQIVDDDVRGKVAYFDGTFSYLGTYCGGNHTNSFPNMPGKGEPYTLAVWLRPTPGQTSGVREICGWGHMGNSGIWDTNLTGRAENAYSRLGYMKPKDAYALFVQINGYASYYVGEGDLLNPEKDEWHLLAQVFDGQTLTTYYDDLDTPAASWTNDGSHPEKNPQTSQWGTSALGHNFTLCISPPAQNSRYKGKMDDFILVPRALSKAELKKIKDGSWKTVVKGDRRKVAVGLRFEDAGRPMRDDYGSGEELTLPKNGTNATIVADADRGSNVASFPGKVTTVYQATGLNKSFPGVPGKSDPFTLGMWVKPTYNSDESIVAWGDFEGGAKPTRRYVNICPVMNNGGGIYLQLTAASNFTCTLGTNRNFKAEGKWHYLATVYDGNELKVYLDDVETPAARETVGPFAFPADKFVLGGRIDEREGNKAYDGQMDDVLLLKEALTSAELAKVKGGDWSFLETEMDTIDGSTDVEFAGCGRVAAAELGRLSGSTIDGGVDVLSHDGGLTVSPTAGTATFGGRLSGAGDFVKAGADDSTLVLDGASDYTGATTVESGSLVLRRAVHADGLVAYWPLDAADDPTKDISDKGWDLDPIIEEGTYGKSYTTADRTAPSDFPSGNDPFTVSVWIKPEGDIQAKRYVVARWGVRGGGTGCASIIYLINNTKVRFTGLSETDCVAERPAGSSVLLDDGSWHQLVCSYDGTTKRIYVDGAYWGGKAMPEAGLAITNNVQSFYVGYDFPDGTPNVGERPFKGGMRDFMVYNRAWSADEVAAEFAQERTFTAPEPPKPRIHYAFDDENDLDKDTGVRKPGDDAVYPLGKAEDAVTISSADGANGKVLDLRKSTKGLRFNTTAAGKNEPEGMIDSLKPFTVSVRAKYVDGYIGGSPTLFQLGVRTQMMYFSIENQWLFTGGANWFMRACFGGNAAGEDFDAKVVFPGACPAPKDGGREGEWMTLTAVYQPTAFGRAFVRTVYLDGERVNRKSKSLTESNNALIRIDKADPSKTSGKASLNIGDYVHVLIDDIQIFDTALSDGEVRTLARSLDNGKDQGKTPVIPVDSPVTVAAGATLGIEANQTLASLSGAGTVNVASGRTLTLASGGFGGSFTGAGSVALSGASYTIASAADAPLAAAEGALALPSEATVTVTDPTPATYVLFSAGQALDIDPDQWTLVVPRGRNGRFILSDDGKTLSAKVEKNGMVLIVR